MTESKAQGERRFAYGREPHIALDNILTDPINREWIISDNYTHEHDNVRRFRKARGAGCLADVFVDGWKAYLVAAARSRFAEDGTFEPSDAIALAGTAYNVVEAIESIFIEMDTRYSPFREDMVIPLDAGFPPRVLPTSRFAEDLDFDTSDFKILHGTLSHKPLEKTVGKLAKWFAALRGKELPKGFYDQGTAAEMADYVFNDLFYFENRKREKGF